MVTMEARRVLAINRVLLSGSLRFSQWAGLSDASPGVRSGLQSCFWMTQSEALTESSLSEPCWESASAARLTSTSTPVWGPTGCHAAHHPLCHAVISHYKRPLPSYSHQLRQMVALRRTPHQQHFNRHSQTLYLILASPGPTWPPGQVKECSPWQHWLLLNVPSQTSLCSRNSLL